MWRYDTNDPASPFHSKIWKWDPKSVTGSLLWEGRAGLWVRFLTRVGWIYELYGAAPSVFRLSR